MSKHALICRFMGVRLNEKALCWWINQKWKPKGNYELQLGARNFFTVIFTHREDRDRTFEGGPYFYNSAGLYITYWKPNFVLEQEDFTKVPVWLRLYSLPVDYWNERILEAIGNKLGVFIKTSDLTSQGKYTVYARICVYMDVSGPLPGYIALIHKGIQLNQSIDYENIPFRCRKCRQHRHLSHGCPLNQPPSQSQADKVDNPSPDFIPVARKSRKQKGKNHLKNPTNPIPTHQNSFEVLSNQDPFENLLKSQAPPAQDPPRQPQPFNPSSTSIPNPDHPQSKEQLRVMQPILDHSDTSLAKKFWVTWISRRSMSNGPNKE